MKHVIKLAPQRLAPKSVITWTVVSQLSWQYLRSSDGRLLVYHNDCQALSTAWFHPVFLLATADTCSILLKLHTHTHPFKGPFSGTTRVGQYQKGKTNLDFTEARDSEWQWHQLGHMQICTSLQTDNHASTSPLSIKALKAILLKLVSQISRPTCTV